MKRCFIIFLIFAMCSLILNCDSVSGNSKSPILPEVPSPEPIPPPDPNYGENFIYIENNQFMVNGKRIWINGVNTPWNNWNDFGGNYNNNWWDTHFALLKQNGINATRIWINCNSQCAISLNTNGTVNNVNSSHWTHLDQLFELAKKHEIYIMATLLSFDHFKTPSSGPDTSYRWREMLTNRQALNFAANYTIPFVNRYKNNPFLWSIDIMNEPDWVHEEMGMNWADISYFLAVQAAAIRENSKVLVTVGIAYAKWNTGNQNPIGNNHAQEGNKVSDQYLQGLYNNPNAKLDFWSPHHYDWCSQWYGVPHYLTPNGTRLGSGTGDVNNMNTGWHGGYGLPTGAAAKPAVIGECSANGTTMLDRVNIRAAERPPENNIINDYEFAFNNGWQGVMAWTSNNVDGNGGLISGGGRPPNDLGLATKNMLDKHSNLIFPNN